MVAYRFLAQGKRKYILAESEEEKRLEMFNPWCCTHVRCRHVRTEIYKVHNEKDESPTHCVHFQSVVGEQNG